MLITILFRDSIVPRSLVVLLLLSLRPGVIDNHWTIAVLFGNCRIVHNHWRDIGFSVDNIFILTQSTHVAHPALVKSITQFTAVQVNPAPTRIMSAIIVQSIYD